MNHRIDSDSAECITYSTDYYKRLTLESWFTNLEQTPLNRCQQLPTLHPSVFLFLMARIASASLFIRASMQVSTGFDFPCK